MNGTQNSNQTATNSNAQTITDAALITNIIINIILAIIFLILYLLSKHFRPKLYLLSDVQYPTGRFAWLRPVIYGPSPALIYSHGMDVFVYLHFLRMCFCIVFVLSIFGLIVMMPINATGSLRYSTGIDRVSGTSILSMANIAPDDNLRLGFQTFAVIFNSFIFCLFLYLFLRVFVKYRVKHKRLQLVENYTVGITGYDPEKWKQERLFQFFAKLFQERIYSMHPVPDIPQVVALRQKRFELVLKKEAMVVKKRKAKGPDYVSKSVQKLDAKIRKVDIKLENFTNSTMTSDLDGEPSSNDKKTKSKVIEKKKDGTKKGKSVKVVEFISTPFKTSPTLMPTNTTYAIFQTMGDAHICSRILTGTTPRWNAFPAPHPNEVYWENHTPNVGSWKRTLLFLLGLIITIFLIVFWIIPVGFATGLANLQTIASIPGLSVFATFIDANATVKAIIEGFLPQIVIIIFFIILVPLIDVIVNKFFLPLNRTEKIRSVIIVYFAFKIVNIYCAGLLSNSFWSIINQLEVIFEQPILLANLLGVAVPAQAVFFINYILVAALRESLMSLWKPGALVGLLLGVCCLAKTPRDHRNLYRPEMFVYRSTFVDRMFVLVLILCYANIQPLILIFGFLYFVIMTIADTHRILYVCRQKCPGGGLMWCTMFNQGCFAVGVYGVTMLGVFAIKKFVAGIVISILVVILVIVFAVYMNRRWFPISRYGSYDSMFKHNKVVPPSSDIYHDQYIHPSLLPIPQDELEYYGDETEPVPENKKAAHRDNAELEEMESDVTEPSHSHIKPADKELS